MDETIAQFDGAYDKSDNESDSNSDSFKYFSAGESHGFSTHCNETQNNETNLIVCVSPQANLTISNDLMDSFHNIIQDLNDSEEKSDRELVADQAV